MTRYNASLTEHLTVNQILHNFPKTRVVKDISNFKNWKKIKIKHPLATYKSVGLIITKELSLFVEYEV